MNQSITNRKKIVVLSASKIKRQLNVQRGNGLHVCFSSVHAGYGGRFGFNPHSHQTTERRCIDLRGPGNLPFIYFHFLVRKILREISNIKLSSLLATGEHPSSVKSSDPGGIDASLVRRIRCSIR